MTSVLVVQALAKEYRVPFYEGLHSTLANHGIHLRVAYGDPPPHEQTKADNVTLSPSYGIHVPGRWLFGDRLFHQPVLALAREADLVIVEQANKHLINIPLLIRSMLGRGRLAFWGHGRNLQSDGRSLGEKLKARTLHLADWWFAYTSGVADYVASRGVDPRIVTIVQNSIDTRAFRRELASVTETELRDARQRLGVAMSDSVGLFCGSVYRGKKLEFLIASARRIRAEVAGFHLLVVGGGPAERDLAASASGLDWVHFLGRQSGAARAAYFRMAKVFFLPALVGLAVLDAFAAGLPVVTTDLAHSHGAEFEYIEHGVNGLVTEHEVGAYGSNVVQLLCDRDLHRRLSEGARRAGDQYTIETMVDNFARGVMRCLGATASANGR